MQGRIKNTYYTKEVLANALNINRDTLNKFIKEEKILSDCLLTGLVLNLEIANKENLPLDSISNFFEDEKVEINSIEKNTEKFYFTKNFKDQIDYGFALISHYGITYEHLNKFIEDRNIFRHKLNNLKNYHNIFSSIEGIQ